MFVRWLGAFRPGQGSLEDSIRFEIEEANGVFACEHIRAGEKKLVPGGVGLLVRKEAIRKVFKGDVWSVNHLPSKEKGRVELLKTRPPQKGGHREAWLDTNPENSAYMGIVIRGGLFNLKNSTRETILRLSKEFCLPIYSLKREKNQSYLVLLP